MAPPAPLEEPVSTPDSGVLWAKLARGGEVGYHPLPCHLLDVAAVAWLLWEHRVPAETRRAVAGAFAVDQETAGRWVAFLAGLHDLGKASPAFQRQDDVAWRRVVAAGFPAPAPTPRRTPHGTITAAALPAAIAPLGLPEAFVARAATVIGGHHGLFPRASDRVDPVRSLGIDAWRRVRRALVDRLAAVLGVTTAAPPQRLDPATAIWLAGLVSVADWIGSNLEHFPLNVPDPAAAPLVPDDAYPAFAAARARAALARLGWSARPTTTQAMAFADLFPRLPAPNPLQAETVALAETLDEPSLVIVEAPMGDGKTEAALYLADRWGAGSGHHGLYLALPTRATSDQMLSRLHEFLAARYPSRVVDLQLLHGQAALSAEFAELRRNGDRLFHPTEVYDDEQSGAPTGAVVAAEWFTHRKRGLLAPFGVGTVDQILLAVLQTRHGFVRLHGLTGKTVVIDEVHAYDAYMSTLLGRLLEWLAALGSPVVLLSATLAAGQRERLLAAYARGLERPVPAVPTTAYPRLSWVGATAGARSVAASARGVKEVRLVRVPGELPEAGEPFALGQRLRDALAEGGCAVVVCNTVRRAQELFLALRDVFPDPAADGDPELDLFHARYLHTDRQERETRTLRRFGKDGGTVAGEPVRRPRRAVLVATQVVEQSLDLDFDLLVTDPAPADLVLQRLGRLHRHPGRPRHALARPEVWLRSPAAADGVPTFDPGTAAVYDGHVLLRSWLALRDRERIRVPAEVADLVEAVYDDRPCPADASPALLARWTETAAALAARRDRDEAQARTLAILGPGHPQLFDDLNRDLSDEDDPALHPTLQALTRLGERSVAVVCLSPAQRAALRLSDVPSVTAAKELLRHSVALGDRRIVADLAALPVPSGWRRSPLLRHHRLLALDERGGCRVGNHRLERNDLLGMVVSATGA